MERVHYLRGSGTEEDGKTASYQSFSSGTAVGSSYLARPPSHVSPGPFDSIQNIPFLRGTHFANVNHQATTLTITDCPCTVTKPVTTTPVVACTTCGYNATVPATKPPTGTGSVVPPTNPPVAAGAGKVVLSGAALAGVLGVAALL